MNIEVSLKLNSELKTLDVSKLSSSELAKGYCEIENAIKFPVKVMKYTDKNDGKVKMFVSYPQRKNGDKYDDIVKPTSKAIKDEVESVVLKEMTNMLSKEVLATETVTDVKINMLKEPIKTGTVSLMAMATITMCGFAINGVQIKQSERGLFVQMPQHKAGDGYQDTVYGTSRMVQKEISEKVLNEYSKHASIEPSVTPKQEQTLEERYPNPFDGQPAMPNKVIIDNTECTLVEKWNDKHSSYIIGQCIEDDRFYFVRFETNGRQFEEGYDHLPTREEVEDDHINRLAQIELDNHEKTYGADGIKNFPNVASTRKPRL